MRKISGLINIRWIILSSLLFPPMQFYIYAAVFAARPEERDNLPHFFSSRRYLLLAALLLYLSGHSQLKQEKNTEEIEIWWNKSEKKNV